MHINHHFVSRGSLQYFLVMPHHVLTLVFFFSIHQLVDVARLQPMNVILLHKLERVLQLLLVVGDITTRFVMRYQSHILFFCIATQLGNVVIRIGFCEIEISVHGPFAFPSLVPAFNQQQQINYFCSRNRSASSHSQ